jgi:hypothetical protein
VVGVFCAGFYERRRPGRHDLRTGHAVRR